MDGVIASAGVAHSDCLELQSFSRLYTVKLEAQFLYNVVSKQNSGQQAESIHLEPVWSH